MSENLPLSHDVNQLRRDKWLMLRAVLGEFRPTDWSVVSGKTAALADRLWRSLSEDDL